MKITVEKNTQIVIALLKAHNVRLIVASPGNTNTAFIGSIQNDDYFSIYSAVDERSAAYMACGLSEDSGEVVVLSCTGATASRNYLPGLTEAYYRKLPILAITSTQDVAKIGHHVAQVIDRSVIQNDVAKLSVTLPIVKDDEDHADCEIKVNQAILELQRNGGGPVHIDLPTTLTLPFEDRKLPNVRVIKRIKLDDQMPTLTGRVAVFVGSHKKWGVEETKSLDEFCSSNNAVVFCDHTSGYNGMFRVQISLLAAQELVDKELFRPDVTIHIGEVSGDYHSINLIGKQVWRVNEDGELRDTFRKLKYIFEMSESSFFKLYSRKSKKDTSYLEKCNKALNELYSNIPELPLSNIWVASKLSTVLPKNSVVHFGILNTLRSWNFFPVDKSITTACNVGGFGIDGIVSSLLGASLNNSEQLYFCLLGDLAFFYDMNALGNRHLGKNIRILIINNGKGIEFRQYNHHAAYFSEKGDDYIAAAKHFGDKSPALVKDFATNLGFRYLKASSKEEFNQNYKEFINPNIEKQPILFEVFTDGSDESLALKSVLSIRKDTKSNLKSNAKKIIGKSGISIAKKILKK